MKGRYRDPDAPRRRWQPPATPGHTRPRRSAGTRGPRSQARRYGCTWTGQRVGCGRSEGPVTDWTRLDRGRAHLDRGTGAAGRLSATAKAYEPGASMSTGPVRMCRMARFRTRHGSGLAGRIAVRLGALPGSGRGEVSGVCRNIRTLYNFEPPATDDEIRAAALQFVRKVSGFASPSAANRAAFNRAVEEVTQASGTLLGSLVTTASSRNRDVEAARAHARAALRYGSQRSRQPG